MKSKFLLLLKNKKIILAVAAIAIVAVSTVTVYAYQANQAKIAAEMERKEAEEKAAREAQQLEMLSLIENSVNDLFSEDGQALASNTTTEAIDDVYAALEELDKEDSNKESIDELRADVADAKNMLLLNELMKDYTVEAILVDDGSLLEEINLVIKNISDKRSGYLELVKSGIEVIDTEVASINSVKTSVENLLNEDGSAKDNVTRESYENIKTLISALTIETVKNELSSKMDIVLASIEARELAEAEIKNTSSGSSASNDSASSNGKASGNTGGESSNNVASNSNNNSSGGSNSSGSSTSNSGNTSGSTGGSSTNSATSSNSSGTSNSSSSTSGSTSGGSAKVEENYYGDNDGKFGDSSGGAFDPSQLGQ